MFHYMSYVVFVLWLPLRFSVHILFFMKSLNGFTYPFFGGASRTHLSCLWFSDILRSMVWCLYFWKSLGHCLLHMFFLPPFSSSGIPITNRPFEIVSEFLNSLLFFFLSLSLLFFSLCSSLGNFYKPVFKFANFFLSSVESPLEPVEGILHLCYLEFLKNCFWYFHLTFTFSFFLLKFLIVFMLVFHHIH